MINRTFKLAALAAAAPTLALAMPAEAAAPVHAQPGVHAATFEGDTAHQWRESDRRRDRNDRYDRYERGRYDRYDRYDQRVTRNTRVWRGNDGRYYCRRDDGTTGLLIGGAAGALLGRELAGRHGDRTLGAILGAAGGALLGREIDRGDTRCR